MSSDRVPQALDKVVVVTGASSGIGAVLTRQLRARGARVVLAARRENELRALAAEPGPETLVVPADVTRREQVERIRDRALERFGRIDVWVNNAGRGITRATSRLSDEDFDSMMLVNAKSALYGMQAVLPHFQARGAGQIVNVSSMLGRVPFAAARSAYCAAKHALNSLAATLRSELRERYPGIHVTTVSPGVVATDFGLKALGGGPDSRQLPGAQPVDEVAAVIVGAIERPAADVYTRPGMREAAAAYYAAEDMATIEARWPAARFPEP